MATLREIRHRISSIKSTQQITRAMKMVAAAKLRKAQEAILTTRPYAYRIDEMIRHILVSEEDVQNPLLRVRDVRRVTIVAVTADRGLCGAFNSNIIKRVIHQIDLHKDKEISLVCVGRKGYDFFSKRRYPIEKHYIQLFNRLTFSHALEIANYLVKSYEKGLTDRIEVVFNQFKNAAQQNLIVETYLPLSAKAFSSRKYGVDYIYEPDKTTLLHELLPKHLNVQMWRILLESNAAEQGARMTAMENATDNAEELIHDLTLFYNRARQTSITKEITEIVGGAEALKSA